MKVNPLKPLRLILSLSKDENRISWFSNSLLILRRRSGPCTVSP